MNIEVASVYFSDGRLRNWLSSVAAAQPAHSAKPNDHCSGQPYIARRHAQVSKNHNVANRQQKRRNQYDQKSPIHCDAISGRNCALAVSVSHTVTSVIAAPEGKLVNCRRVSS
jgi:hypothetical protein